VARALRSHDEASCTADGAAAVGIWFIIQFFMDDATAAAMKDRIVFNQLINVEYD